MWTELLIIVINWLLRKLQARVAKSGDQKLLVYSDHLIVKADSRVSVKRERKERNNTL